MHQQRRVNVDKEGAHRQEQGDQQPDKPFFQAELVRDKAEERLHQQGDKGVDRVKQPGLRGADAKMLGGPDNEESHGRRPCEQVEEIEKTQQKVVSLPDVMFQFLQMGRENVSDPRAAFAVFWHVIRITLIICYDILIDDAATDHMRYCDHCCTNFVSYCHFLFINFSLKLIVIV